MPTQAPQMPPIIIENSMPEEFADQLIRTQESIIWKLAKSVEGLRTMVRSGAISSY